MQMVQVVWVSVLVELHLSLLFGVERVHVGDRGATVPVCRGTAVAGFGRTVASGDGVACAVGHLELVDGLLVLAQVVQAGELFEAEVALEGSFARVFADVSGQVFGPREDHRAARIACALEELTLGFLWHGAVVVVVVGSSSGRCCGRRRRGRRRGRRRSRRRAWVYVCSVCGDLCSGRGASVDHRWVCWRESVWAMTALSSRTRQQGRNAVCGAVRSVRCAPVVE